jgi:hypothetical protein
MSGDVELESQPARGIPSQVPPQQLPGKFRRHGIFQHVTGNKTIEHGQFDGTHSFILVTYSAVKVCDLSRSLQVANRFGYFDLYRVAGAQSPGTDFRVCIKHQPLPSSSHGRAKRRDDVMIPQLLADQLRTKGSFVPKGIRRAILRKQG